MHAPGESPFLTIGERVSSQPRKDSFVRSVGIFVSWVVSSLEMKKCGDTEIRTGTAKQFNRDLHWRQYIFTQH